jgi:hypothetical protein
MVRGLLALVLGGWLGCGCLLSNPPDYVDPEEHWPLFVSRIPEKVHVAVDVGADDFPQSLGLFEAVVHDGNVDQELRYRWFMDYDPERPDRPAPCGLQVDKTIGPSGLPERTIGAPSGAWYKVLVVGDCHRLTLVVTDGSFEPEGCAAVTEGSHRIANDWWLLIFDEAAGVSLEEVRAADCLSNSNALSL